MPPNAANPPQQPIVPAAPSTGTSVPKLPGYTLLWADDFDGLAGAPVNPSNWTFYRGQNNNGEISTYTSSTSNVHLSGTGDLNIVPLLSTTTPPTWTSARIHGSHPQSCPPGKILQLQARIRLGANPPQKQKGIWPAFWALGNGFNTSSPAWPTCGEWDILELVNGGTQNNTTIHTGTSYATHFSLTAHSGPPLTPGAYHVWTCRLDRTVSPETLSFLQDGIETFKVIQDQVKPPALWEQLAHGPVFPLLNVAVGGDFPALSADEWKGLTAGATLGGVESGMQVSYVAFYLSQ